MRHTTLEARKEVRSAEKVLYLLADPVSEAWVRRLNRNARSLQDCYVGGERRLRSYRRMVRRILQAVRSGHRVCVAFYGHPGVFVYPSHEAVRKARREGYPARMVPGISAEDCLFADLGIDPARSGAQSFEATDFLVHRRRFDPGSSLILWQVGAVGDLTYPRDRPKNHLEQLAQRLLRVYGPRHPVVLYEASPYRAFDPVVRELPLADLAAADVDWAMTLYVPPRPRRPDARAVKRLGLAPSDMEIVPPCWVGRTVGRSLR